MTRYDLITPEGTRDLLFEECLARRTVENRLCSLFSGFGYSEVVTPGIEFYDIFMGSSRNFRQESMYKLTDPKGRLIAMRPDSTIPIARLAATRLRDAGMPLRLYYDQTIYVNNALLKGKSDEFVQAGIELIGGENIKRSDYEALAIAAETLSEFDKDNFRLEIGHIGYFKELVARLGVDERVREEIRMLISQKNYPALDDLLDETGNNEITDTLKQLPRLFGGEEVFAKAEKLFTDEKIEAILKDVKEVYGRLSGVGYEKKLSVDLGIVSHTDYYTGIVFKGYLSGVGQSVLKGGRYDGLLGEFGKPSPAVGFGVNCDEVANFLRKNALSPAVKKPDCIVYGEKGFVLEAALYGRELVRQGLTVENSLFDTLGETKEYAAAKGIHRIFVVGESVSETEI